MVHDGTVVSCPGGWPGRDEEIIAFLSTACGIGRWTAEVFLLFQLRRLDVWPAGGFGIRRGYGLAGEVPAPTAKELEPLGDPYRRPAWWRPVLLAGRWTLRECGRERADAVAGPQAPALACAPVAS
jgi:3-methyladenine DNA glycosylase/8-oxoguanine DNA glycosylase